MLEEGRMLKKDGRRILEKKLRVIFNYKKERTYTELYIEHDDLASGRCQVITGDC